MSFSNQSARYKKESERLYFSLKNKEEEYTKVCERVNDCSICPLKYDPPQYPSCEFMAIQIRIKEIEKEDE